MISKNYAVYIMTNSRNTVLYVGKTSNLQKRVRQHKKQYTGFTAKYNVTKLVYYEPVENSLNATKREKQLKNLVRRKKLRLVNNLNPDWKDLFEKLT